MTQLSDFTAADAEVIISLPYRIGLHVSYADDEGGEQDDVREMQALEACLKEVAKQHSQSGLVHDIAAAVLQSKDKWEKWSQGVFNIAPACEQAVLIVKTTANADEVKAYVRMNMEIASAVAQAYGEFGEDEGKDGGFLGKMMGGIIGRLNGLSAQDKGHPMNVSAAEDSAMSIIVAALKKNL